MEDEDVFREQQRVFQEAKHRLRATAVQGRFREQERTRCLLTLQELEPLPDATPTYRSLGRAYLLSTKQEVVSELQNAVEECDKELGTLQETKLRLDAAILAAEANLKEHLAANPELARSMLAASQA